MAEILKIRIRKFIFSAAESGYAVIRAAVENSNSVIVAVGNLAAFRSGDVLLVEGNFVDHPRFGRQFKVIRADLLPPREREALIDFFAGARFKGVGRKSAEKIVAALSEDCLKILEEDPRKIYQVRGLSRKAKDEIFSHFAEKRELAELFLRLSNFGIKPGLIHKIYARYKRDTAAIISQNPYSLIAEISGVGFHTADLIARAFSIKPDSSLRIRAALRYLIDEDEYQNGNLFFYEADLLESAQKLLQIEQGAIAAELKLMVAQGELVAGKTIQPFIQKPFAYLAEKEAAKKVSQLLKKKPSANFCRSDNEWLSDEQKRAVHFALENQLLIITGPPGSGKTTIIKELIRIFAGQKMRVALAAPTGRAAKRMTELCGYEASTVHRLLKFNPESGRFEKNARNQLEVDALIVDEFSMIDAYLFFFLLQAFPDEARLIIIGDKDQLPSVGAGNVLRDLIACRKIPVFYLNTIYRQQNSQLLIKNAIRINQGEMPEIRSFQEEIDFILFECFSASAAKQKVIEIARHFSQIYGFNSLRWQILAPMYKGEAGIDQLNNLIQEKFNSGEVIFKKENFQFKIGDKILQLRNNYQKDIFNGDIGIISGKEGNDLIVDFYGRRVSLSEEEMNDIALSYVTSIHKAQGSEFDLVILIMISSVYQLLTRELLYTAVTRARKRLIILSNKKVIAQAISNTRQTSRRTNLLNFLEEA